MFEVVGSFSNIGSGLSLNACMITFTFSLSKIYKIDKKFKVLKQKIEDRKRISFSEQTGIVKSLNFSMNTEIALCKNSKDCIDIDPWLNSIPEYLVEQMSHNFNQLCRRPF